MARGTTLHDIPFTGNPGLQVQKAGFERHVYFALFVNDNLLNCFVAEANRYADKFIPDGNLRRRSHANDWSSTDMKEMKQFLGWFFFVGIIHKPAIHMYWSKDPLLNVPPFSVLS